MRTLLLIQLLFIFPFFGEKKIDIDSYEKSKTIIETIVGSEAEEKFQSIHNYVDFHTDGYVSKFKNNSDTPYLKAELTENENGGVDTVQFVMYENDRIDEILEVLDYPKPDRLDDFLKDVNEKGKTYFGKYKGKALMVFGTKTNSGCTLIVSYTEEGIENLEKLNEMRKR